VAPDVSASPISNHIRRLRFEHQEMTQQLLAERIGVTRQTVNAIELGKYSPSLEVAFRIAAVFGEPLEAVFQYREPVNPRRRG
jgi:putative transcriptional regulator